MMGWRLTCFSLLALFSLTDSRPSLLGIEDGGHHGDHHQEHHGEHQEHHRENQQNHVEHQEHHGVHEVKHHEDMQFLAERYTHREIQAEPYIHEEILAEPYIHQQIEAEPYIHQENQAEPYIHQEILAETYKLEKIDADPSLEAHLLKEIEAKSHPDTADTIIKTPKKIIKRKRVLKTPSSSVLVKSKDATKMEDTDDDAIKNVGSQTVKDSSNLIPKPYTGEIAEVEFTGPKFDPETLKQDQSFKFSFSSSDYSRKEESDANGNVRGSYSFKNEDGEDIEVKYTAGANTGFVLAKSKPKEPAPVDTPLEVIVVESNLPPQDVLSSHEDIIEVISGTEGSGWENEGSGISANHEAPLPDYNEPLPVPISQPDTLYGAPSHSLPSYNEPELTAPDSLTADSEDLPSYNEQEPAIPASLTPDIPVMIMNPNYKFAYNNEDSSRTEHANPDTGIITGQYSYTNPEGTEIKVKYRAGAGIGFVIDNQEDLDAVVLKAIEDGTPLVQPKADTSSSQIAHGVENELAATLKNAENEKSPVEAKPYSGEIAEVEFVGPKINSETWEQDHSFKFGFKTTEQSRKEESDANGNVRGSYSFKNENGEDIEVKYTAGADTGFVVENLDEVRAKSKPQDSTHIASKSDEIIIESQPLSTNVNSIKDIVLPLLSTEEPSGLYGAPSAPLPAYNEPPPSPVAQLDTFYDDLSEDLPSYNEQEPAIPAPLPSADNEALPSYNEAEPASLTADIPIMIMNPKYKFAYKNDDSSRTEDANPDTGIITGQYSYTNPEGNEIEVKYRAGAGIGFVIDNQEELVAVVLKATEDGADASTFTSPDSISAPVSHPGSGANTIQPQSLYAAYTESLPSYNEYILPTNNEESLPSYNEDSLPINNERLLPSNNEESLTFFNEESLLSSTDNADEVASSNTDNIGIVKDASFKFSVEEENQSFQEESDVNGERTGSYSYTSPDGELIVVRYRAGRDGFVILNPEDVFLKAPVHNF